MTQPRWRGSVGKLDRVVGSGSGEGAKGTAQAELIGTPRPNAREFCLSSQELKIK